MGYYKINQLKMPLDHDFAAVERAVCKQYGFPKGSPISIDKKSVDARKKNQIRIVYNLKVTVPKSNSKRLVKLPYIEKEKTYDQPKLMNAPDHRPIVIGAGPAGLFAALILAEAGAKPIVLERGQAVEDRLTTVETFFKDGELNTESNIQFGEGGAGTFSDGKINTGVKDRFQRNIKIVETFVEQGAPEAIRYASKPHIGTDYLVDVVKGIREKIIALGGEVRFNSRVESLVVSDDKITAVTLCDGDQLEADKVILAIGHSARDTFRSLVETQIPMEQKSFAIGLRIEHPQAMIGEAQYGKAWQHKNLPVADYKLTYRTDDGRGVYTFCMCPGGFVVNSASEEGMVVCNGMSNYARDEVNANSAVLVNVHPDDFGSDDLLAGVEFQRKWERKAFELAGSDYSLPVSTFGDFKKNRVTGSLGSIRPNEKGKYTLSNLNETLPPFVADSLKEGIHAFGRKIKGFDRTDAVLTGVETRSSSPIRILRNDDYESPISGLYPCGEGAGYAGGIMSAALDGIKVAEAVIEKLNKE